MSWQDELQQATFRGIPFAVLGGESRFGRRVAVHQYPMRDKPYVEDLGRSTRRINLAGFLVENSLVYGGGSVISQREAMVAAAEAAGPAQLVHPTLGELTVSISDGGLSVVERWDTGRYFELSFSFIESGDRLFPSISASTGSALSSLAAALDLGAALDFVSDMMATINLGLGAVQGVISLGNSIVGTVVGVVAGFAVIVGQASRDVTSLANLASLLTGNYGRYVSANVSSAYQSGSTSAGGASPTIGILTAQGAEDRANVASALAALAIAAQSLDASTISNFAPIAQAVTQALSAAIVNPGDAVRLFGQLSTYTSNLSIPGTGQTQSAQVIAETAVAAMLRRASIGAIARAAASYVPSSYDDAIAVRNQVTGFIDTEILIAGDNGDDATYGAMRSLRQSVVAVLTSSGANLAHLQTFSLKASLPALVVATRLYQDPSRSDQLVGQCDPIHPAFMPTKFQALAS